MTARKLSTILIITVVATFVLGIIFQDKSIDSLAKMLDVALALSLLTYSYSYLPLEKNRKGYIRASLLVSFLALIINILVIINYDFQFGSNV